MNPSLPPLPGLGTEAQRLDEALRVDHAGELAAIHIYTAQSKVFEAMNRADLSAYFGEKAAEEQVHHDQFCEWMRVQKTRPTLMTPLWRLMATGLGGATALMGERAAHVCTEAVENVIEQHYDDQINAMKNSHPEWTDKITPFRDDERRHRDEAVQKGGLEKTLPPHLQALRFMITKGCQAAIKISEKI
jgi:ubiquinone biosynthesis monooxygenase Coq7